MLGIGLIGFVMLGRPVPLGRESAVESAAADVESVAGGVGLPAVLHQKLPDVDCRIVVASEVAAAVVAVPAVVLIFEFAVAEWVTVVVPVHTDREVHGTCWPGFPARVHTARLVRFGAGSAAESFFLAVIAAQPGNRRVL